MKCCLCGKEITPDLVGWEHGCNPWPLAKDGRCCWKCDRDHVFPARLDLHRRRKQAKEDAKDEGGN